MPAPVSGGGYQPALDDDEDDGRPAEPDSDSDAPAAGPRPPPASSVAAREGAVGSDDDDAPVAGPSAGPPVRPGAAEAEPVRPRRVLGPAAPPPEVLEAAAELADALIGPPPPDLVEEDDGALPATREEAVKVVLKVRVEKHRTRPARTLYNRSVSSPRCGRADSASAAH